MYQLKLVAVKESGISTKIIFLGDLAGSKPLVDMTNNIAGN